MQLTPNMAILLNVIYGILTSITAASLSAAGIANAETIVGWASLIAAPLNIILHAYSAPVSGALASPPTISSPTETPKP